jgi:branched-subunit amino acid transport protein AzlD
MDEFFINFVVNAHEKANHFLIIILFIELSLIFLQIIPFLILPHRKHTVSMRNTNRLILSRKTIAIYCEEIRNSQIQSVRANDTTSGAYKCYEEL